MAKVLIKKWLKKCYCSCWHYLYISCLSYCNHFKNKVMVIVIKMMWNVENITNNDEFFADTIHTPKESVEHHRKRECLKRAISSCIYKVVKNNGLMKKLIKLVTKLSIKYMLNTSSMKELEKPSTSIPVGNYMFKVNNMSTRTRSEICSKLTILVVCTWVVKIRDIKKQPSRGVLRRTCSENM